MSTYKTLHEYGMDEIIIEKSTFIGYAKPIKTEEEAIEFINEIKKKHKDATHNVWAYTVGKTMNVQRYSDDGEPQGTAGVPTLNAIQSGHVENAVVVVVRYFGGILLGASGLTRAYRKAASMGINACETVKKILYDEVFVSVDYQMYNSVRYLLTSGTNDEIVNASYKIIDEEFAEDVLIHMYIAVGDTANICRILTECTQGKAEIIIEEKKGRYTV